MKGMPAYSVKQKSRAQPQLVAWACGIAVCMTKQSWQVLVWGLPINFSK